MKHAYLIMAHNDFYILEKLLRLIDDKRNDIYIHIDKKVKNFDFSMFKSICKKSNVYFTKRIKTNWATYSLIKGELILFKTAHSKKYAYYHLLSGVDLPLVSQNKIHDFFKKNAGKEFICYDNHNKALESTMDRVLYYHVFTSGLRSKNKIKFKIFNALHYRIFKFLKKHNIKRKVALEIRKGSQWISITNALVEYILDNEKLIKKTFKYGYAVDELFIQTLVYNSNFYNNLYGKNNDNCSDNKRYIDWERGKPYTFVNSDFKELINCR